MQRALQSHFSSNSCPSVDAIKSESLTGEFIIFWYDISQNLLFLPIENIRYYNPKNYLWIITLAYLEWCTYNAQLHPAIMGGNEHLRKRTFSSRVSTKRRKKEDVGIINKPKNIMINQKAGATSQQFIDLGSLVCSHLRRLRVLCLCVIAQTDRQTAWAESK